MRTHGEIDEWTNVEKYDREYKPQYRAIPALPSPMYCLPNPLS